MAKYSLSSFAVVMSDVVAECRPSRRIVPKKNLSESRLHQVPKGLRKMRKGNRLYLLTIEHFVKMGGQRKQEWIDKGYV